MAVNTNNIGLAYSTSDTMMKLDGSIDGNNSSTDLGSLKYLLGVRQSPSEGNKAVLVNISESTDSNDTKLSDAVVTRLNVKTKGGDNDRVDESGVDTNRLVPSLAYVDGTFMKNDITYAKGAIQNGAAVAAKCLVTDDEGNTPLSVGSITQAVYFDNNGKPVAGMQLGYQTTDKNYGVQADSNGKLYVNVPWSDADVKTAQNVDSTNGNYPVLFSKSSSNNTDYAFKNANVYINPSTGNLQVTKINGLDVELTAGTAGTSTDTTGTTTLEVPYVKYNSQGRITESGTHTHTIDGLLTDTKNTAGATNSTSKLFLIGSIDQTANPVTNSHSKVYMTNGSVTAEAYYATSDRSLKKNITDLSKYDLDKVSELPIVEFDWKDTNAHSVGVIAQDIEDVIPEAVSTSDSGIKSVNYTTFLLLKVAALEKELKELKNKLK